MSSKETPKKVYSTVESNVDPSSCRFCGAAGDASHRKNIFKPLNQHLLKIAEKICASYFERVRLPSSYVPTVRAQTKEHNRFPEGNG